jgi:glyoxylase-like metal-dependent hydrolase (beta-lactamase superfamily II)
MGKKWIIISSVAFLITVICSSALMGLRNKFYTIKTIHFDPNCTILVGGGGNSVIVTSEDGAQALVVDTKFGKLARKQRDMVSAKNITLVNTHTHGDHSGGDELYPNAQLIAGAYSKEQWTIEVGIKRYPDQVVEQGQELVVPVGTEIAHLWNMGQAHTLNDVVVFLEKRKMLITGDLVFVNMHPALFTKSHSSVKGWITRLDSLRTKFDIATLVPGHGDVADSNAVLAFQRYFISISDAINDAAGLQELRKKYRRYVSIPGISSFSRTVEYKVNEEKDK